MVGGCCICLIEDVLKNIVFANRWSYQQVLFFKDMCLWLPYQLPISVVYPVNYYQNEPNIIYGVDCVYSEL